MKFYTLSIFLILTVIALITTLFIIHQRINSSVIVKKEEFDNNRPTINQKIDAIYYITPTGKKNETNFL